MNVHQLSNLITSVPPYYLFQGRPVEGNEGFWVPLRRGYRIFELAKKRMSGVAKRARYAMSHATGKIEILGFLDGKVVLKYHQAKDPENLGHLFSLPCPPDACWLDDLTDEGWHPTEGRRQLVGTECHEGVSGQPGGRQ